MAQWQGPGQVRTRSVEKGARGACVTHAQGGFPQLLGPPPAALTPYQGANCALARAGLINSGGASSGESDLHGAVFTAVVNKRAGGMGMISGRKAFQRPGAEGVQLLNAIQDVYRSDEITIA